MLDSTVFDEAYYEMVVSIDENINNLIIIHTVEVVEYLEPKAIAIVGLAMRSDDIYERIHALNIMHDEVEMVLNSYELREALLADTLFY